MKSKSTLPVNTGYAKIRDFYTNEEFHKRFFSRLFTDLKKNIGEELASSYFKSLYRRIDIVNKETFYNHVAPSEEDIGISIFKRTNGNFEEFCQDVLVEMQRAKDQGKKEIDLSTVFILLSHFRANYFQKFGRNNDKYKFTMGIESIICSTITGSKNNPFKIQILPPRLFHKVADLLGIGNGKGYLAIMGEVFEVFSRYKSKIETFLPKLEIILPVYSDLRGNQTKFLAAMFRCTMKETKAILENVPDLSEYSPQMQVALSKLLLTRRPGNVPAEAIMAELQRMKKESPLISYNGIHETYDFMNARYKLKRTFVREFKIETLYPEETSFLENCYKQFSKIRINCSNLTVDQIERYANIAAELSMLRLRNIGVNYAKLGLEFDPAFCIELGELGELSKDIIAKIKEMEGKIRSKYNRKFILIPFFSKSQATEKYGNKPPTHLRVISDIHADVNRSKSYIFNFGTDFVVNCGDTSGDLFTTKDWIRTYIRKGVNVVGNHMGYSLCDPEKGARDFVNAKNVQTINLLELFEYGEDIKVLSNHMTEYDGIIFLGTTLYTDFKLFGEENQAGCMIDAARGMNDFRVCTFAKYSKEKKGYILRNFSPEDHAHLFKCCFNFLRGKLRDLKKKGNKKPIVIVSHHAPTPYSVADKYKNSSLSAAFASDLREFLLDHPEIRLWCHGHCHDPFDYIYGSTRVVCEPFGYFNENNVDIENYGKRISIAEIKSSKTWEQLLKDDIKEGRVKIEG